MTERAIGYVRVSLEREEMLSPEIQRAAIEAHAARNGYTLGDVIEDLDRTGRNFARAGVQDAISRVERGEADVVLVWKVSRFGRTRKDWYVNADRIEVAGGRLESATEDYDAATSTGRFTRGLLVELAAFESDRIGEGWKEVHANRRNRGLTTNGNPRYGYQRTDDGVYVPDPETAPILAGMYADAAAGMGPTTLAKRLNAAGVPGPKGGAWYADRVNGILTSGFGAGYLSIGKRSATTWVRGAHEAVVSEETWQAYLAVRAGRATGKSYTTAGKYVLSGLLRCGACGARMSSVPLQRGPGYAFLCSAYKQGRHPTHVSVTRKRAEATVLDWLRDYAAEIEEAAAAAPKVQRPDTRQQATRRRVDADKALAKLAAGWATGIVPDDAYAAAKELLVERLEAARAAERAASAVSDAPAPLPAGLLEEWDTLAVEARRAILAQYIDHIEVTPVPGSASTIEVIPLASH